MRTPLGSSKIVARSLAQSSPGCEPSGVIFTFWALAGTTVSIKARAAPAQVVFIFFSKLLHGRQSLHAVPRDGARHEPGSVHLLAERLEILRRRMKAASLRV